MQPGNLDQKITIQTRTETEDGYGGFVTSWANSQTIWAKVKIESAGEVANAEQVENQNKYEITTRSTVSITNDMRIIWNSKILNVKGIFPAIRTSYQTIKAEELNTNAE